MLEYPGEEDIGGYGPGWADVGEDWYSKPYDTPAWIICCPLGDNAEFTGGCFITRKSIKKCKKSQSLFFKFLKLYNWKGEWWVQGKENTLTAYGLQPGTGIILGEINIGP